MARAKKTEARVTLSNVVDWAIIDKRTNQAVGVFNPQGNNGHLRLVALRTARTHKIPFIKMKLIPVELLSAADLAVINLNLAPVLALDAPTETVQP